MTDTNPGGKREKTDTKTDGGQVTKTLELKMTDPSGKGEKEKWYGYGRTIPIPNIEDYDDFNTWKKCVIAWSKTTSIPKSEQGFHLCSEVPISSKKYGTSLREDIYKHIEPDKLVDDTEGVTKIIEFLESRFWVDTEDEIYSAHHNFKFIQRKKGQSIRDYILEFDTTLKKCFNLRIHSENDKKFDRLLALELMVTSNLTSYEFMMIRSVGHISTEDGKRYETVKSKMREILGKTIDNKETPNNEIFLSQNTNTKSEDDNLAREMDDVYISKGWAPPGNKRYQNGAKRYQNYGNKQKTGTFNKSGGNKPFFRTKAQNPLGPDGKPMKCLSCKAITHLIRDCPDSFETKKVQKGKKRYQTVYMVNEDNNKEEKVLIELSDTETEQSSSDENVYCTVLCAEKQEELSQFTAEALNMGALDTCCTASVAGEKWTKIYLQNLPKELKKKVIGPLQSKRQFMFGNQGKLTAKEKYTIPVKIGGEVNLISIDIIESDIPLLISKKEMKNLGITLDMRNDKGTMNGKPLSLNTTSAGHYVVDLLDQKEELNEVCIAELEAKDTKEQKKALIKIHKQFGHRPKKQFVTILKEADQWDEKFSEMIDDIMDKCEGCILRRKTPDRPAVAAPMTNDFGQVLGLDLKIWDKNKGVYILYMIDHFTRYQVATIIKSKESNEVIDAITTVWLPIFGRVDSLLTDNGGEFTSEEIREVASALNMELKTTGANSPWQNGIVERNHATTDAILTSIVRDYPKMKLKVALAWAVTAVNGMSNVRGFSPNQLVFGRNLKLPNILDDPPPAWEIPEKSKQLIDTLEAIHAARLEYTKTERCERLRRALKAKIRVADTLYEKGDIVYFKKEGEDTWRGPAKVVFQDSKVIFIRIGSVYYRVSANRLIKAGDGLADIIKAKEKEQEDQETPVNDNHKEQEVNKIRNKSVDTPDWVDLQMADKEPRNNEQEGVDFEQETNEIQDGLDNQNTETVDQQTEILNTEPNTITNRQGRKRKKTNQKPAPEINEDGTIKNAARVLKRNDRIEILEDGQWEKGTILGHGGKVTGKYSGWYNIQLDNGERYSKDIGDKEIRYEEDLEESDNEEQACIVIKLDTGEILHLKNSDNKKIWFETEEETTNLLITEEIMAVMLPKERKDSPEAMAAKMEELGKLQAFNTYKVVKDKGQDRITTTWVLTEKGNEVRARLTARGFQEEGEFPTDSPTVQKHSLKLLLAIAATEKWDIKTTDITAAFLQGNQMDRDVYVQPPREIRLEGELWLLNKCLYGLKDASRKWYLKVVDKLKKLDFQTSHYDSGLFYLLKDNKLIGIVALHVDDFLHAGTPYFNKTIMPQVLSCFKVGKSESRDFMYTGFHLKQTDEGVRIDQDKYVRNVNIPAIDLQQLKDRKREMKQDELTLLRQITGIVNWAARATRPDLSFDMIDLSTKFKGGKVDDLIKAKNVATRLKKTEISIMVSDLDNLNECEIIVYTDAAFRNLNDNTDSCGSYVILIVNKRNGKCAPIEWKSGKLKRKVHSTLGAETQALYNGLDAALGIKLLLKELYGGKLDLKVRAVTDNRSARDAVYSESEVTERVLRGDIAVIKEMVHESRVEEIRWVTGENMLADLLTKRGVNKIPLIEVLEKGRLRKETLALLKA